MIILNEETIKPFGRIRKSHDFIGAKRYIASLSCIENSLIHIESDEHLASLKAYREVSEEYYGRLPVRIGYYIGYNEIESPCRYHKSSTLFVAVSECQIGVSTMCEFGKEIPLFNYFTIPQNTIFELFGSMIFTRPHNRSGKEIRLIEMYAGNRDEQFSKDFEWESDYEARYLECQNTWEIVL